MSVYRALAPAKVNLGLFLGPIRAEDSRHELVTVMQSISLADELTLESPAAGAAQDELICPAVAGPAEENLAAAALRAFRSRTGWDGRPVRLTIVKRIPVAAGLAGGSADAAATLRLASCASGLGDEELLRELGAELGADVPAQVSPGRWLASGAGERLQGLPDPSHPLGLLLLPAAGGLSTAEVYREADRLGRGRSLAELKRLGTRMRSELELSASLPHDPELLHNDLQDAAISLCPQIAPALRRAADAGAEEVFLSGSGPTVVGLFSRANAPGRVERAISELAGLEPPPVAASSVGAAFGAAAEVPEPGLDGATA